MSLANRQTLILGRFQQGSFATKSGSSGSKSSPREENYFDSWLMTE
jgi:hypothetical protein